MPRLPRYLPLVLLTGCLGLREFPNESVIDSPRVLAVVAEPPEVTPGHALTITPLIAHARDVEVEYRICGTFDAPFGGGGAQFGEMEEEDCGDGALISGSGPSWTIPVEVIDAAWANTDLAETILGGALPPETIDTVRFSVGLPLLVDLTIQADGQELRALKRVLMSENPSPHSNPPPPHFTFGKVEVRADPATTWTCSPDEPLHVKPGAEVEIAPATDDGQETWLEQYNVIDAFGTLEERSERGYYAWFASAGRFEKHGTRAPLRNQVWTAPSEPGRVRLWIVVRDGHGGTSACRWDVDVDAPEPQTL